MARSYPAKAMEESGDNPCFIVISMAFKWINGANVGRHIIAFNSMIFSICIAANFFGSCSIPICLIASFDFLLRIFDTCRNS